jgi:hypothetical protein
MNADDQKRVQDALTFAKVTLGQLNELEIEIDRAAWRARLWQFAFWATLGFALVGWLR